MGLAGRVLVSLALTLSLASTAFAATITGTVQGPDGKPLMGAFVVAENAQNKMTVSVLSNAQGRYHIANLPAATYTVRISAVGYKGDPRADLRLSDDQKVSFDFALQKAMVRWSDLSTYQGRQSLPKTEKHDLSYQDPFFTTCFQSCHSFQKRMATNAWDEDGWRARVKYMREVMMEGRRMSDDTLEDFVSYLTTAFGPNSPKPASPADLPQYKSLVRPFSPKAMNIVYVEYDFGADSGMGPWSAVEDKGRDVLDSVLRARQCGGGSIPRPPSGRSSRCRLPRWRRPAFIRRSPPPTARCGSPSWRPVGSDI